MADASAVIDLSPILTPVIQAVALVVSATALPLAWYVINWIRSKLKLSKITEDDAIRRVLDQGLQKSVGAGISRVEEAVAGLPMTVETKNKVVQVAAEYAINTIGDTLKAAKLDSPERLAAAIEARLGVMEMQTSTGQAAPAVPSTSQPSSQAATPA